MALDLVCHWDAVLDLVGGPHVSWCNYICINAARVWPRKLWHVQGKMHLLHECDAVFVGSCVVADGVSSSFALPFPSYPFVLISSYPSVKVGQL